MKRSNRLVLLIGIFLAVVAFVLILITLQGGGNKATTPVAPTTTKVVIASRDIPLGTKIAPGDVTTKDVAIPAPVDSYADTSFVVGQVARQTVIAQQLITSNILTGGGGSITSIEVPKGFVGLALQVDQITGVGTLIKAGDYVDVVTGITGKDKVPVVTWQPSPSPAAYAPEGLPYNPTTVKTIVQGLQVLGILLPPPPASGAASTPAPANAGTTLNGQQELVIVAATAQQAEAIKFSQMDGDMISLALRAAADCRNADGTPAPCASATTTGITLRVLVESYGVLPPQVIQVIQPPAK